MYINSVFGFVRPAISLLMQCLSEHADWLSDDEMDLDVNYRQLNKCVNNTMVSND